MSSTYILALDQGTTSSRTMIFDRQGNIISSAQKEFRQIYPRPGWVEHDPEEIWSTQFGTLAEAVAKAGIRMKQIAGIGITNQRETTLVWDKKTGKPLYNAIVWQDRRTAAYCDQLKAEGSSPDIQKRTGLIVDSYFSATKLKWILDEVPGARKQAEAGTLAFGTVDSWLSWKLSGGNLHITDASNASRSMLMNIHSGEWDQELLKLFNIPPAMLPEIKPSSKIYGVTGNIVPGSRIPIAGIAGDQQAALFGQLCIEQGMVKNTYGTGCFMLMNTGKQAIHSNNNLLSTIAWQIDGETHYALEGSVFIAGAVVQWLRDEMKLIRQSPEIEELSAMVADAGGVYIVPAFAGLGAPHWNPYARGTIFGLTRGTNRSHLARAALDSIAYQVSDILRAMEADSGISIRELRIDGGATCNNQLMQFQSDILNCRVVRPKITETTALGAAYLAGLAVGYWRNINDIRQQWQVDREFIPLMDTGVKERLLKGWQKAVQASIYWADQNH